MSFLGEIKRRKVFQVAAVYAVVAWLAIQIIATVEAPLNLPDWVDTLVIVLLAIGFPITLVISWAFNLTPEGLARENGSVVRNSGRQIEYFLIGLLVVAVGWLAYRDISSEETPIEEVERITQLNRNAIYQAVHRVKRCLRDMLAELQTDRPKPQHDG